LETVLELDIFNPYNILEKLNYPYETFETFHQICADKRFSSETHKVITKDGYINVIH